MKSRYPHTKTQWLITVIIILASIAIPIWLSNFSPSGNSVTIKGDISGGTINQSITQIKGVDPETLAKELAKHLSGGNIFLQKGEEIQFLTQTIERLKNAAFGNESKQAALQKLLEGKPQDALELLKQAIKESTDDSEKNSKQKAQEWTDIGNIAFFSDTREALEAYKKALALDPDDIIALNSLGNVYRRLGKLDEATQVYEDLLEKVGDDQGKQAIVFANIGLIYLTRGEFDKAENTFQKVLDSLDEKLVVNLPTIANAHNVLGASYSLHGELDTAEKHYRKALEISETIGKKDLIVDVYNNLGGVYLARGELAKAEESHLKGIELGETIGWQEGLARNYGNLAIIYRTRGELAEAEGLHLKALKIQESLQNKEGIASNYGNLGVVYLARGDIKMACQYWQKAGNLYKEIGTEPWIKKVQQLTDTYCKKESTP